MGENRLTNFRKERDGSRFWLLLSIIFLFLLSPLIYTRTFAADELDTIGNPGNTTIDIFDYYVYDANGKPTIRYEGRYNSGINENHTLWFDTDTDNNPLWNHWPKYEGGVTQGIVQPILGADGFPVLNCGKTVTQYRKPDNTGKYIFQEDLQCVQENESLAYLFQVPEDYVPSDPFDPEDPNLTRNDSAGMVAWQAYPGINKLFLVDDQGNYYFNSEFHKAIMDRDKAEVHVYAHTTTSDKEYGFYPFSVTGQRPKESGDQSGWFFGTHIHADFSIPYDYQVQNQNGDFFPMVYNFKGDDDVWVFIDGVLIGDIGGIHSRHDLSINFETGEILIKNTDKTSSYTTIRTTIWQEALKAFNDDWQACLDYFEEKGIQWKIEGYNPDGSPIIKTFAGSTYHTMDFFYLERGAGGSNMQMQYNLVSTNDFTAHKSLHRSNAQEDQILQRDQFRYRLTGFPETDEDGHTMEAIMPKKRPSDPITWVCNYDPNKTLTAEPINDQPKTLIVGNSPDGNVNFGNADLDRKYPEPVSEFDQYVGTTFRYIIEELPPEGAVPAGGDYLYHGQTISPLEPGGHIYEFDGVQYDLSEQLPPPGARYQGAYTWNGETVNRNNDGTYTFGGITYDNTVYYYKGTLRQEGWFSRTWYKDDTYTERVTVTYAGFNNMYDSAGQAEIKAAKKYLTKDGFELPTELRSFNFKLTKINGSDDPVEQGNSADGKVVFPKIFYTLKKDIPQGETEMVYTYLIEEIPGDSERIDYSSEKYYARVYLTDGGSGKLLVDLKYYKQCADETCSGEDPQKVIYSAEVGRYLVEIPEADVIFTNQENVERELTVKKQVDGNIGSRNKPFSFTLTMPGMKNKTVAYSTNGGTITAEVGFDNSGTAVIGSNASFTLKHDDTITFYGIDGAYVLVETTDDGYTTTWESTDDPGTVTLGKTAEGTITLTDSSVTLTYTNTLEITPPTGIQDSLAPALAGIAAVGLMLLTLWTGKKREENG